MFRQSQKLSALAIAPLAASLLSLASQSLADETHPYCPYDHGTAGGSDDNVNDANQHAGGVPLGDGSWAAPTSGWVEECCTVAGYTFSGGMTSSITSTPILDCKYYWGV
jgi:hypothetical protein